MSHAVADPEYDLEFRAVEDDAWYSVRVILQGEELTVTYWTVPPSIDRKFSAGDFDTAEALDDFRARFRPVSHQLQDSECLLLTEGMAVCASCKLNEDDVRFHDAIVDEVYHEKHSFAKQEEECSCVFMLYWLHGPNKGNLTLSDIGNICLVKSDAEVDHRLASFVNLARAKMKIDSLLQLSGLKQMMKGRAGKIREHNDQDRDLGGRSMDTYNIEQTCSQHVIVIDNLEKDLSPLSIMEFLHKHTSVAPQAYVSPSLPSEMYTRGAIVLDCEKKLKKIYDFLTNPNHIIMSSKGRPWVVHDKLPRKGNVIMNSVVSMPESQHNVGGRNAEKELKVSVIGSKDYAKAKLWKDLALDFLDHQKLLHNNLALEETKIS